MGRCVGCEMPWVALWVAVWGVGCRGSRCVLLWEDVWGVGCRGAHPWDDVWGVGCSRARCGLPCGCVMCSVGCHVYRHHKTHDVSPYPDEWIKQSRYPL